MRLEIRSTPCLAAVVALAALSAPAASQAVQVDLAGSYVQRISVGAYTVEADELTTGTSSGDHTAFNGMDYPPIAADDLNLASYFARSSVADPTWTIDLGRWRDINGPAADFFLFEIGGNDAVDVQPILSDGSSGQWAALGGWSPTSYHVPAGANKGQQAYGLAFGITDLLGPGGAPLGLASALRGLRLRSAGVDGASFSAVDPSGGGTPAQFEKRWKITGERRVWHPLELWLRGPRASELDVQPNPFLDYRMQVLFRGPSGQTSIVQGFFDGDGEGGGEGQVWKARFAADEPGPWTFRVRFRSGPLVAVDPDPLAGSPIRPEDASGQFDVLPRDPAAPGFLKWGRLEYVGGHYLKFRDGPHFIKGGADSPENLLGYLGFDDAQDAGNLGILHRFEPHRQDWRPGDEAFAGNTTGYDSRGLTGALNYLASQGVNSVYAILMNLGGDGQDVAPFLGFAGSAFDDCHHDISRLHQWEQVFRHAQRRGIQLHLVPGETEPANEQWLDGGALGVERKLYYREMVARFGHHLAVKWNLCEENDFSDSKLSSFADWIDAQDPYDHPIAFHTHPDDFAQYGRLAGDPRFSASSVQYSPDLAGQHVETLRQLTAAAGRPWAIDMDENGPAATGLGPHNADDLRKRVLWDVYLSGGSLEWFLGSWSLPIGGDVTLEDFRTREPMWGYMAHARAFMEDHLPFWEMQPMDPLLSGESSAFGGGEVFARAGEVYAVYLPQADGAGALDLSAATGQFLKRWYDPRSGQLVGAPQIVQGGASVPVGSPPSAAGDDWVVWFEKL